MVLPTSYRGHPRGWPYTVQEEVQIYSQELIFFLLPPWLSLCTGGSGGVCFTANLLLPTVTSCYSSLLVQGDGEMSTAGPSAWGG